METPLEPSAEKPQKPAPYGIRDEPTPLGTRRTHTYKSRGRVRSYSPNHSGRFTLHLDEAKAIDLIEAAVHAREIGRPLNRFITIHLEKAGIDTHGQPQLGKFLKLAGQWLGDRGVPATYIWVMEKGMGTGLHVHMLIHVPAILRKDFSYRARYQWPKLAKIEPLKGVIYTSPPTEAKATRLGDTPSGQSYLNQLRGALRYMLKAIDKEAQSRIAPLLGTTAELLKVRPQYSSPLYGRRCSRSENIGAAARARYAEERIGPVAVPVPFHQPLRP